MLSFRAMRKRFQNGSLQKQDGYWRCFYRIYTDTRSQRKSKILGRVDQMTKTAAREAMARHMRTVNLAKISPDITVERFVEDSFIPMMTKKWKASTKATTGDRIAHHIVRTFRKRELQSVTREELQAFLDARKHLSFSTVDHLRWDLRDIFGFAVSEGILERNPAAFLFTPRECRKAEVAVMTIAEVKTMLGAMPLRERLVLKFAVLAGMRPGEIFALKVGCLDGAGADIQHGVYRGVIDTPKTQRSIRVAALPGTIQNDIAAWIAECPHESPDSWLFPSVKLKLPLRKDNWMYRHAAPILRKLNLGFVNFHVLRATHSSLLHQLGADPKLVADQLGHDLDVHMNIYTKTSLDGRLEIVETLSAAVN